MPDPPSARLTLEELERLRGDIRTSVEHARDELDHVEALILMAADEVEICLKTLNPKA